MSQTTQIELEPKGCIFHNLCIHNSNLSEFCQVEHPLRRNTQAPASQICKPSTEEIRSQQPKGTSHRCRKLHRSNSNKSILSSIILVFRMQIDLSSAKSNTPLRRKTQAPVSHLCKPSTEEIRSQQPKGK